MVFTLMVSLSFFGAQFVQLCLKNSKKSNSRSHIEIIYQFILVRPMVLSEDKCRVISCFCPSSNLATQQRLISIDRLQTIWIKFDMFFAMEGSNLYLSDEKNSKLKIQLYYTRVAASSYLDAFRMLIVSNRLVQLDMVVLCGFLWQTMTI